MKYRVELKPVRKYKAVFEAETLAEIAVWMEANCEWQFCGTDGTFEERYDRKYKMRVAVTTRQSLPELMDDNDNVPTMWSEAKESYNLCNRVKPGRTVGMGNS